MDKKERKFDIIVVAGQSNAEGNGMRARGTGEVVNPDVFHFIDKNPSYIDVNEKGEAVLHITMPPETIVEVAHERECGEMIASDFSETFANEYIKGGNLAKGRSVLIVKAAVGGAGFMKKQWGVGNPLSDRLLSMIEGAMSLSEENRIVAFLWHQGEHDAYENDAVEDKERYDFYYKSFTEQVMAVRERYGKDIPVLAAEFVRTWEWGLQHPCRIETIYSATRDALKDMGKGCFISSEGLKSNNEAIGNGDDIHFSSESVRELGARYYKKYSELI